MGTNSGSSGDEGGEPARGRARETLDRLEDVLEADVAEARAVKPLVDEAERLQLSLRARLGRWVPLLLIAAAAIALVTSGAYGELSLANLAKHHEQLLGWVAARPVLSALALVGALAAIVSTGLPGGMLFTVAAGLFFGIAVGGVLSATGNLLGGSVLYFAARRFFDAGGKPPALVAKIRDGFNRNPVSFAFFVRLVPAFPYGAASAALAWLGCRYPLFVLASALGVLPTAFIYAALGAGLSSSIAEHRDVELSLIAEPRFAIPLLALAVLALIPALIGLRRKPDA